MSLEPTWRIAAITSLAAAALLSNSATLLALTRQSGPLMAGKFLGLSESHDRRAFRILERPRSAADLVAAEEEAKRALDLSPYDNAARLRLMYIDTLREHGLTPAGRRYLAQSYDVVPLDHTVAAWRVGFALEHWERLTPDLRKAVEAEAMAFGAWRSKDANVLQVLQNVHNPAGRVSAALWLQTLQD